MSSPATEKPDYRFDMDELVPDSDVFGPALARVRKALGASQKELGQHALVAASTVATYETSHRDPSPEAIVGIAVACGVEPWSAAQHGRLLVDKLALRRDAKGITSLVADGSALAFTGIVGVALTAAQVARFARDRKRSTQVTEVVSQKLISKALSARPLPSAEEKGVYALVDPPSRKHLEKALQSAADALTDDELMALIAALHGRDSDDDPTTG